MVKQNSNDGFGYLISGDYTLAELYFFEVWRATIRLPITRDLELIRDYIMAFKNVISKGA